MQRIHLFLIILLLAAVVPASAFDGIDVAAVKKMAEAGNADAQSKLGVLYSSGLGGVEKDTQQAVRWYRKSADQGNPLGQWNLAFMYVKGEGVEVDYAEARELFRKAAEKGFVNAQYDLGVMLVQGLGGQPDRKEGEKWLRLAANQGYKEAIDAVLELELASK